MQITRKEVFWSYLATFLKISSSAIILPIILNVMPSEKVGVWTVFMTITSLSTLLDFGFNPSFTRNITYVFSGVRRLTVEGFDKNGSENKEVDYKLLVELISAMKWFYSRISFLLLILLLVIGTFYIKMLLQDYESSHSEVYLAWLILCVINGYNLYTMYYNSLLLGKGLVKKSQQIIIIGNVGYLLSSIVLILLGFDLVALVSAQAVSVIIIRVLSFYSFYDRTMKNRIKEFKEVNDESRKNVLKIIFPNALKIGLTSLGGFLVQKSSILIGALYLTLDQLASYGVTMQIIGVISGLSIIYTRTFQPKIVQLRVFDQLAKIKLIYIKGQYVLFFTYFFLGSILLFFGNWSLELIESKTTLLSFNILLLALLLSFIETNLSLAGSILLTKNEVPFFKASLISGAVIVLLLFISFNFFDFGLITLIIVPLIVDLSYQAWKWPVEVMKDLKISFKDYFKKQLFIHD